MKTVLKSISTWQASLFSKPQPQLAMGDAVIPSNQEHLGLGAGLTSKVPRLKTWFKRQNECGRYLKIRALWRWLKSLYEYHPPERFVNSLVVRAKVSLGFWKLIEIPASVTHTRFHVCLNQRPGRCEVVKLPHGRNNFSCELIRKVREPGVSARYFSALTAGKLNPWFRDHCVTITGVRHGGGYTSEYIKGINLAQLREDLSDSGAMIPKELRLAVIRAAEQLLKNLQGHYQQHGKLIGDWPLHNLVFSPERERIINVDAEGFFTYDCNCDEAHFPFVAANLLNLIELIRLMDSPDPDDLEILNVFKVLNEVRRSGQQYSGAASVVGYHSLELKGRKFRGQRECSERLAPVPFDFKDKVVVDLGCNVGGMLHSLAKTIRRGYGFDLNPNCINAAQLIKSVNKATHLEFFTFDLDVQPLSLLQCFLGNEKVDICFLLSMCRWLKHWRNVVRQASEICDAMLFESNGSSQQQREQHAFLQKYYRRVDVVSETSPDDFVLGDRKLYLCTQPVAHPDPGN